MTDQVALLAAVRRRPTDRLAKLAYADWLEEQGLAPEVAYAYRWAAAHGRHPLTTAKSRVVCWRRLPKECSYHFEIHPDFCLPCWLYDANPRRYWYCGTLELAFASLAAALATLRGVTSLEEAP